MLSKVSSSELQFLDYSIDNKSMSSGQNFTVWRGTAGLNGTATMNLSHNLGDQELTISKNGVTVANDVTQNLSASFQVQATDIIVASIKNNSSYSVTLNIRCTGFILKDSKKDKIYELKNIGNKATAILFGKLPTGEWRDGN